MKCVMSIISTRRLFKVDSDHLACCAARVQGRCRRAELQLLRKASFDRRRRKLDLDW
jgi:hypothetical protein